MLWSTLYNKIGKQPLRNTQRNQVYAILENPKTHQKKKVFSAVKIRYFRSSIFCPGF